MEWLLKFYDTLDSVTFELRLRWAGRAGQTFRSLALLVAIVAMSSVSPNLHRVIVSAVAACMLAEILSMAARVPHRHSAR